MCVLLLIHAELRAIFTVFIRD